MRFTRISICFLIASLLIIPVFSKPALADFKKTKIAVLDFQIQGEGVETKDMGKIVAEWLITALVQEGRFDIIERRLLEKVLEEQNLGMSGLVDARSASKLGKVLGARIVVSGSVIKLGQLSEVTARLIDVESGSILTAEKVQSETAIKLEQLITRMAEKIIKDFPIEGYIVERTDDRVMIDLGKRAGVKEGMKFKVNKEGKIVRHPKTGEILDVTLIETGKIEVLSVREKTSEARVIADAPGQKIEYGHLVRSTAEKKEGGTQEVGYYNAPAAQPAASSLSTEEKAVQDLEKIQEIRNKIDRAKAFKDENNREYSKLILEAYGETKGIFKANATSPEVWLLFAKCYWINDRLKKAEGSLGKAFYYNSKFTEGHLFRGEMYLEEARKLKKDHDEESLRGGFDTYRGYAKSSFETVASISGVDSETKAKAHYRLGEVYADLYNDKNKAREQWNLAAAAASSGQWVSSARESLAGLQ